MMFPNIESPRFSIGQPVWIKDAPDSRAYVIYGIQCGMFGQQYVTIRPEDEPDQVYTLSVENIQDSPPSGVQPLEKVKLYWTATHRALRAIDGGVK